MASGIRPFHPAAAELGGEIPIFPLAGALLLPGGRLPLNIFEPRYLAMVEDALGAGRMFGMIQPDALKPDGPNGPALFTVGCLGRVTSFAETEDGRIVLSLLGLVRFTVVEERAMRRGYRRLLVDYAAYRPDLAGPEQSQPIPRERLMLALRGYFERQHLSADWDAILEMEDHDLLTALCMMCPFAPPEKQALLEAETVAQRVEILQALLEFGLHGQDNEGGAPRPS